MAKNCKQFYYYRMNSKKYVRAFCNSEDIKYGDVVRILSDKTNKNYTYQSLQGKLTRNTFTYEEACILADALGYDLIPIKRK